MTTVHRDAGGYFVAVKGALDALVPLLRAEDSVRATELQAAAARLAEQGYRVLAIAERHLDDRPDPLDGVERDLRFNGLVGISDPPRAAVTGAIATCRSAGIRTVMITGDHPGTARAIATRIGILSGGEIVTGPEIDAMSDADLAAHVEQVEVYARTTPEQKLRIVDAWKALGAVVAMTGDGVNDAPALRRADVGVAMGITGTDVSREAADIVLADDNFATIVGAVAEGRRIYDNIRRFVRYLLTTNSGELFVMLLAPLLGLPFPLLAIQILWINLVTDGLPAVALGLEPAEPDVMARSPHAPDASILGAGLWQHALRIGLLMAAVTIGVEAFARSVGWHWQTMVFTTLALLQLGNALAVRSEVSSFFSRRHAPNRWLATAVIVGAIAQLAVVYVLPLRDLFDTETLGAAELAVTLVASSAAFAAVEAGKWRRRSSRR